MQKENLTTRVVHLEDIFAKHLEESGSIRTDLSWLKKSYWVLTGGVVTGVITLLIALVTYLLNK